MAGQQILIYARFVVKALQKAGGYQLDEVAIPFLVLAQQHQVVISVGIAANFMPLLRYINLAADHGVDALFLGGVVEFDGAEEIAVIGHGDRGHLLFDHQVHELGDFAGSIEQGVVGVAMKMDERCGRAHSLPVRGRADFYLRPIASGRSGRNGQIRTAGLPLRRRPLYPSELRPHFASSLPAFQAFLADVAAVLHPFEVNFGNFGIGGGYGGG